MLLVLAWCGSASAAPPTPPTPPFKQCPTLGFDTSCAVLIVFNPDGSVSSYNDPTQGPFDGIEDTLIGVQNNSSSTVTSLALTGLDIFGFDDDGLCSGSNQGGGPGFQPPPSACPFGPTGYEGPNTSFTITDPDNGTVNFLNGAIKPGESTYFSLEEAVQCSSIGGTITCAPAGSDQPISAQGTTVSPTEGASFSGNVATFTDPDPASTASEYSATIDWGDGSPTSSGTISGNGGNFTVRGTHTYTEEKSYPITVTITDVDNTSNSATANSTANVSDAPLSSRCAAPTTTTRAYAGPTATFTDADPNGQSSDYTATIAWGDNSSSSGTVSPGTGSGPYTVSGSHTYGTTGQFTITTTITDAGGAKTVAKCNTLAFAFAPGGGSFVIGDKNSAPGTHVLFWGAQWWKENSLSGGTAPASFKGFALKPASPRCGTNWSTDPGNSAPPPSGPLPPDMGVIVSSKITKSGSQISGDTQHIVIVKTNPGYQPNPGHPGTGTVEARVC